MQNFEKLYKDLSAELVRKDEEISSLKKKVEDLLRENERIADSVRDEYLHSGDWMKSALEKVVYFSAIELQPAGIDDFFEKVVNFLGDGFFGYRYCGFFRFDSSVSKWEAVSETLKDGKDNSNVPEFNGNAVIEEEQEYFNFFEITGTSYMVNISLSGTSCKFSRHDFSFFSLFMVLGESILSMKFADRELREKMIENSSIHHSNRIIASLNEEKISFEEALAELVSILNIDSFLFARSGSHTDDLKIVLSGNVQTRSWDDFLRQIIISEEHFNENWLVLPIFDEYLFVYGVTAFMLSRNSGIRSVQERILDSSISQLSTVTSQKKLHKDATTDELTGAYNRRYLMKILEERYKKSRTDSRSVFSVAMLDIDNFKTVNDTYGHQAGDLVLKNVVAVLNRTLREIDIVGRFGGEEFIVIISAEKEIASRVCERMRNAVEKMNNSWEGREIWVTVSIGCAASVDNTRSLDELIALSDICLYEAKKTGKNKVVEFSA